MERTASSAAGDALQTLCFSDPLFRERYDGWHVLGRGAFATVVRTRSRDTAREIALKIYVNLESDLLERVRKEVSAAQSLSSPYVVDTYSLFSRGTLAWFEMEWVDGPSLDILLRERAVGNTPLSHSQALEIALAIARVIWHAHRRGVLHRDLKPSNVIVPRTSHPAAKVTDFGIAHLLEQANVTPRGVVIGTPRFASPEALAGSRVGTPHDVYGLGMTLFALFSGGRLPHDVPNGTSIRVLRRIRARDPRLAAEVFAPGLDARIACLITRCLAPQPRHRPSLPTIVTTLEAARRNEPAVTASSTTGVPARPLWPVLAMACVTAVGVWQGFLAKRRAKRSQAAKPT